jgi:ribosomal protein S12 methylthiotransferase
MRTPEEKRPLRAGLISLGCAKNLVDSEIMLGSMLEEGIEITNDPANADVMIVNTCSFIDAAQEESVDTILESDQVREARKRNQALVVAGCLPQRFRDQLPTLLPEVDAFMGIDQVRQVGQVIREALERRRQKAGEPAGPSPKAKRRLMRSLEDLAKGTGGTEKEESESLRGTTKFGNTRVVASSRTPVKTNRNTGSGTLPFVAVDSRPTYIPDYGTPRFRLTPRHFAYLKIAEGCNHPCSFCIIPRMRGRHRSRLQPDIVAEARGLIADGVKELNLISQDSTYYGLDLRPGPSLPIAAPAKFNSAVQNLPADASTLSTLLRELNSLPGDFWIRLLYTHPAHWTDELIQTIAECPKVARYIDIPLQHIHDNMLERMRRETSRQHIEDLLRRIRTGIPGVALRTTFIVGFPGETEEYFETLLGFIREARFERLGVFTFSQEEGTRAGKMAGQIPEATKKRRKEMAMAAQHEVAVSVAESYVGRTLKVLVERVANARELQKARVESWEHGFIRQPDRTAGSLKGTFRVARGEADAPDIDGRVYVKGDLATSEFAEVRIIGHTDYDLVATATETTVRRCS